MPEYCVAFLCLISLASAAEPPKLRLGDDVQPRRYRLDLTVIPEQDTFNGKVEVDLDIRKPTDLIWLNARNLTIDDAKLVTAGSEVAAKVQPGGKEFAGFALPSMAPVGSATLRIAYHGEFNTKGTSGLFKLKEGDDWYVFSQFESIDARQAFPCLDEPSFKVPWQLTLHVNQQDTAVSNTLVQSETPEAGGRKKVVFGETKPLPSYLVAMGVGPFDFVDAGKAGRNHTPLRVITPKGKRVQAQYAAQTIGPLLDELENYFGIPYPYSKLDALSVPLFGGAMENAGLITYGQTILLCEPTEDTIGRQRGFASIAAHEMAHQWFGDLVTTAWWDDIWLNEAFASWMSSKVIRHWKPEWNTKLDEQNTRSTVMEQDTLVSTRQIRQPIENIADIANAFDNITYSKGEAVIGMFESWMGEEAFQHGVQRYLRQYSSRNATAGDFLDSLGSVGSQSVARPFSTFLNQPGAPLVSVKLDCDGAGPTLHLTQKRALPLGSTGSANHTWQIPVCARYGNGSASYRDCTLLTEASTEWKLPQAKSCPAWVMANADGKGYYRTRYEGSLLGALLDDGGRQLSAAERVATLGDVNALTSFGEIKAGDALALVPRFAGDPVRQVVSSAIRITEGVYVNLVPIDLRPNYSRFVAKTFGDRAHQLGWNAKPGEEPETHLLRTRLVPLVAVRGNGQDLAAQARQLAENWLTDRKSVDPDIVDAVLTVSARTGDQAFFKQLVAALPATQDRQQRGLIFGALGSFRDPAIAEAAIGLMLKPEFDLRESMFPLLFSRLSPPETPRLPFNFIQKNYDAIAARIPTGAFGIGEFLPFVGGWLCDEKSAEEVNAFFAPKVDRFPGAKRNLDQSLEYIRLCAVNKAAQQPSVEEFLRKY